jgi:ABC-type multidrug transport system ATPase subunit
MKVSIQLDKIGKRYNKHWIFKDISYTFSGPGAYVIKGKNGSGKSTFLQLLSGNLHQSSGEISYQIGGKDISVENIYSYISFASPYLELYEEFTLQEAINFQASFKTWKNKLTTDAIISILALNDSKNKILKQFSTGMKQRLKLGLSILADVPILLLDEPASNLDKSVVKWYQELISVYANSKLIIVCSNDNREEYYFCNQELNIENYKIENTTQNS